jgi:WD40 repeat protein
MALRWALVGAACALLAACRSGDVAGRGAACGENDDCRFGFRCVEGSCRAAPDAGQVDAPAVDAARRVGEAGVNDRRPATIDEPTGHADAADTSVAEPVPPDAGGDASADVPPATPTFGRCNEYPVSGDSGTSRGVSGAFSPDGRLYAIALVDGKAKLWTVGDDRTLTLSARVLDTGSPEAPWSASFSADSTRLATDGRAITVWRVADGLKELGLPFEDEVRLGGFSRDGARLAFLTKTQLTVRSLPGGGVQRSMASAIDFRVNRSPTATPPGHWWLAVAQRTGLMTDVGLVDLDEPALTVRSIERKTRPTSVDYRIALAADGNTLAVGDEKGVALWDVHDKEHPAAGTLLTVAPLVGVDHITDLEFSPGGGHLAVGIVRYDRGGTRQRGEVVIYEVATGRAVAARGVLSSPHSLSFSPDGLGLAIVLPNLAIVVYCRD